MRCVMMICSVCILLIALGFGLLGSTIRAQSEDAETVRITVLYDNSSVDKRLKADWGFSALIEYGEQTILFDTGTDGAIVLDNMAALKVDPSRITKLVLSHEHSDHLGGLPGLFAAGAVPDSVFVLPSFSDGLKDYLSTVMQVIEVEPGQEIIPGIITTGELTTGPIPEQALLIDTADGLIVMTGCAHPGIVEIIRTAGELSDHPIALVMGGFHLLDMTTGRIRAIIRDLQELEVARIAPSHCTGSVAIDLFKQSYGENFVEIGAGSVLEFTPLEDVSRLYYHFVRSHETLLEPVPGRPGKFRSRTSAMALGLTDRVLTVGDLLRMPLIPTSA